MTRFDITRILAPTAIKPRTSGPRDGSTGIHSQHIEIAPAMPAKSTHTDNLTTLPETHMHNDTQGKVLAALTKKSPSTRDELGHETRLDGDQLSNAIYNLKKKNLITGTRDQVQLADGRAVKPAANKAKASKPVHIPCGPGAPTGSRIALAKVESCVGIDNPATFAARLSASDLYAEVEKTSKISATRAIATADGGCIVVDGVFVVAELNKEQRDAVAAAA